MEYNFLKLFWEYYDEEWSCLKTKPPKYIGITFEDWLHNKKCNIKYGIKEISKNNP